MINDVFQKIQEIDYYIDWFTSNLDPGKWRSKFLGSSLEFEKITEYTPGDDFRQINWIASSRSIKTLKNEYLSKKNITIFFIVDNSQSMIFGTEKKTKIEVSAEISAILAYSANKIGDEVGLTLFPNFFEMTPKISRNYFIYIHDNIISEMTNNKNKYELYQVLERLPQKKCLVFIISDFLNINLKDLDIYSKYYDIVPIIIEDKLEQRMPNKFFLVNVKDLETNENIYTTFGKDMKKFRKKVLKERKKILRLFSSLSLDFIRITAQYNTIVLTEFFMNRRKYIV